MAGTRNEARRERADGRQTREEILEYSVQLASREGLEALTIGRLAEALGMSKSGLFAHFGSKEGLQLAVLERASGMFGERVRKIGREFAAGLERLAGLLEAWMAYVEKCDFQGGCFFTGVSAEFDGRPGVVRDALARLVSAWVAALEAEARKAAAHGHLAAGQDVGQLVFELHAYVQEANWAFQLLDDPRALSRARAAILARLQAAATPAGRSILTRSTPAIAAAVRAARAAASGSDDAGSALQMQG